MILDINEFIYDNINFSVTSIDGVPVSIQFNNDGSKLFFLGNQNKRIYELNLTSPYDISTASYSNVFFSVSSFNNNAHEMRFNDDGTKIIVIGESMVEYSLSNPYDITTASYNQLLTKSFFQGDDINTLDISNDGTKLVYLSTDFNLYEYSFGTPYDISTLTYTNNSVNMSSQFSVVVRSGMVFNGDGTQLFIGNAYNNTLYQYSLSTPYDISTLSYNNKLLDISGQLSYVKGLTFNDNFSKFFMVGRNSDRIFQYDTGFEPPSSPIKLGETNIFDIYKGGPVEKILDIENAVYDNVSFDVSSEATGGGIYDFRFNNDGTVAWVITNSPEFGLFEYSLSTPFDISTMTYTAQTNISLWSNYQTNPRGFSFNDDGTQIFIAHRFGNEIAIYDLSTAYDITTMSFNGLSDTYDGSGQPHGIEFSNDGNKLFIVNRTSNTIFEFSLNNPYDLSTMTLVNNTSLPITTSFTTVRFNSDGTQFFTTSWTTDKIYKFILDNPYDVSTLDANTAEEFFLGDDIGSYAPGAIEFNNNYKKLYVGDLDNPKNIYQFSVSSFKPLTVNKIYKGSNVIYES